jgi:hypothetical protein
MNFTDRVIAARSIDALIERRLSAKRDSRSAADHRIAICDGSMNWGLAPISDGLSLIAATLARTVPPSTRPLLCACETAAGMIGIKLKQSSPDLSSNSRGARIVRIEGLIPQVAPAKKPSSASKVVLGKLLAEGGSAGVINRASEIGNDCCWTASVYF